MTAPAVSTPPRPALRLAVVGAGSRVMTYAREALLSGGAVISAIVEPREDRRDAAAAELGVPDARRFADWRILAGRSDPELDAVVIATPDRQHTAPALAFLDRGLPLLLEKPMAPSEVEARQIVAAAERSGAIVCVAHVLRYTAYTALIKELIDGGAIGDVVSVDHLEPVGWWHQAHSYVRGNWRREDESSPMLLAKCCHDVDWLSYVIGRPAVRVSSFGGLRHFTAANKPAGAGDRCLDCAVEPDCPYSAKKIYLDHVDEPAARLWPLSVLAVDVDRDSITRALEDGPYGRCVYACDNDVVDHQVVNIEYTDGVTASLTMTAFTPMGFRRTRIFGTRGTLEGNGYTVDAFDFLTGRTSSTQVVDPEDASAGEGHLGADRALTRRFLEAVRDRDPARVLTSPAVSLHSHATVWAAERARHHGTVETVPR